MANALKAYPNVIFEAWNEPSTGSTSSNTIPSGYLSLSNNNVRCDQSSRINKPDHDAVAAGMGT